MAHKYAHKDDATMAVDNGNEHGDDDDDDDDDDDCKDPKIQCPAQGLKTQDRLTRYSENRFAQVSHKDTHKEDTSQKQPRPKM